MDLSAVQWIILAAGAVVVVAAVVAVTVMMARRKRRRIRSERLQRTFGPEYDAAVDEMGRKRGEADLEDRARRFRGLDFEALNPRSREAVTSRWAEYQYRFVEDPTYSVREAEHLVGSLLHDRGYPSDSAETLRALSVSEPELAQLYRQANDAYRRTEDGEGPVDQQFEAMASYRQFVEALLRSPEESRPRRTKSKRASSPVTARSGS